MVIDEMIKTFLPNYYFSASYYFGCGDPTAVGGA
jgi:hypothetical protein